jgi:hypothetical protein
MNIYLSGDYSLILASLISSSIPAAKKRESEGVILFWITPFLLFWLGGG